MNIVDLLQMVADTDPDRRSVTCGSVTLTYAELLSLARKAATLIEGSEAQYVSVLDANSPVVPVALFGAAIAGIPYVPLNYRLAVAEVDKLINRIEPLFLITNADSAVRFANSSQISVCESQAFLQKCTDLPDADAQYEWLHEAHDPCVQLFTSGTTGTPKTAILRHGNLVSYILNSVEFMSAGPEEANLTSVPPYHIAGISAVLSATYSGRRIVQLKDFSPEAWLATAEKESITNAFVVPTMLSRVIEYMRENGRDYTLGGIKAIAYGGGKMPLEVIEDAMSLFPQVDFTNAYGLTETSSTISILGPDDHRNAYHSSLPEVRRRLASVGRPLPSISVSIKDDEGNELGANEQGEIFVKGDQVSGEYLERNGLDNEGWFPTRDRGYIDSEGFLFLDGRADDVIVRGGENISPGEVEDVIRAHPAVSDVAVLGIPSKDWGEAVAAVVVLTMEGRIDTEQIQQLVRSKLRSSRVPESVLFITELPYNEMGKLLRRKLVDLFV